jgi:hypothetical protein
MVAQDWMELLAIKLDGTKSGGPTIDPGSGSTSPSVPQPERLRSSPLSQG